jgi:pimeloyl-ACP methyl ester carboxylesterase
MVEIRSLANWPRRDILKGGIGGITAASVFGLPDSVKAQGRKPTTFILVHGSWHWGGCFMMVANNLATRGYAVATPDLATHGYDTTAPGAVASMEQYTQSAAEILEKSREPVVLVGHSMGGATCTYLAEKYPDKISSLVYLTAFMCPNGVSANDYIFSKDYAPLEVLTADPLGVRLDLSKPSLVKETFYADCDDHLFKIAAQNVIPVTPDAPAKYRSNITSERFGRIPRFFIECEHDKALPIAIQRKMQNDVPGAKVITMPTSHSPFFSAPGKLTEHLAGIAG